MKYLYKLIICILFCQPWTGQGAVYSGRNADDAYVYLENSEGKIGFGFCNPGCARKQVPPEVRNFSLNEYKTAFDTQCIQNEIAHRVLSHPKAQAAMATLNEYNRCTNSDDKFYIRQDIYLTNCDLNLPIPWLTGTNWVNGSKTNGFTINGAVIVLQHFDGQETNRSAPVHIFTLYPVE